MLPMLMLPLTYIVVKLCYTIYEYVCAYVCEMSVVS